MIELGYGVPAGLRLVPDDFETDGPWWAKLAAAGSDAAQPAVVASLGVSMYLTREANQATLRQLAGLAPGSTVVMTFQPPLELLDPAERPGRLFAVNGARASGTPFRSFFSPAEIRRPGPGGWVRHGTACTGGRAERALLQRAAGRPAHHERRGAPGRHDRRAGLLIRW